jgi:hypothetical protein
MPKYYVGKVHTVAEDVVNEGLAGRTVLQDLEQVPDDLVIAQRALNKLVHQGLPSAGPIDGAEVFRQCYIGMRMIQDN